MPGCPRAGAPPASARPRRRGDLRRGRVLAGSPRGCVLWAEALGCGRGVPRRTRRRDSGGAAAAVRGRRPQACLELADWLDFPGARTTLAARPARANATYAAAEIALTNGPGGPRGELLARLRRRRPRLAGTAGLPSSDDRPRAQGRLGFREPRRSWRRSTPEARVTRMLAGSPRADRAGVDAGAHLRLDRGAEAGAQERPVAPAPRRATAHLHPRRARPKPRDPGHGGRVRQPPSRTATTADHAPPPPPALLEAARGHAAGEDEGCD